MTKNIKFCCLIVIVAISLCATSASAEVYKPLPAISWKQAAIVIAISDSVPAAKSQPENKDNNQVKNDESIKEVPKSRKQEKPMPVTITNIKPVIVKPKIIVKPIIKVH